METDLDIDAVQELAVLDPSPPAGLSLSGITGAPDMNHTANTRSVTPALNMKGMNR